MRIGITSNGFAGIVLTKDEAKRLLCPRPNGRDVELEKALNEYNSEIFLTFDEYVRIRDR